MALPPALGAAFASSAAIRAFSASFSSRAAAAGGQFLRLRTVAGVLLIPYLAWLVFAATLNSAIDTLNPGANRSLLAG